MCTKVFLKKKSVLVLLLCIFSMADICYGQQKTEGDLVQKIVLSLQQKDSSIYTGVFLSADSMALITLRKAPSTSDAYQRSRYLRESPAMLIFQDSMIKNQAGELYKAVILRGQKMGLHWNDILLSRYELEALAKTRDEALEAIAPERFVGYVFVEDMQTRKIYCLTLSEMMKIDGKWYGGELNYIFEADTKDIFNEKLKAERIRLRKGLPDTTGQKADSIAREEEEPSNKRKQIADRKLYTGTLDEDIPINLYIRSIKGDCPDAVCSWEAIIKIADEEYMRYEVSKDAKGMWTFIEEETGGVMEVELKGNKFIGSFSATNDKIDYDSELKEKTMTKKKLESLDAIIERDLSR